MVAKENQRFADLTRRLPQPRPHATGANPKGEKQHPPARCAPEESPASAFGSVRSSHASPRTHDAQFRPPSRSPGGGRNRQIPANTLPITEWKTLEIAHGTAAKLTPVTASAKCFFASTAPNPEFYMPTSMETVRQVVTPWPSALAKR